MVNFSYFLRSLRLSRDITLEEMAAFIGITKENLILIERGRLPPPPSVFIPYANRLGISVECLALIHFNDYIRDFCKRAQISHVPHVAFETRKESSGVGD